MAINGTYKIAAASPMGKLEGIMVLRADGETLSGTLTAMGNTAKFLNGRADGDAFEFGIEAKTPMGPMKITVKGTVGEDKVSGSFITSFGQMPFEGGRTE
jgi:hypothetical protein